MRDDRLRFEPFGVCMAWAGVGWGLDKRMGGKVNSDIVLLCTYFSIRVANWLPVWI